MHTFQLVIGIIAPMMNIPSKGPFAAPIKLPAICNNIFRTTADESVKQL